MSELWHGSYIDIILEIIKCIPICYDCHVKLHSSRFPNCTHEIMFAAYNKFWEEHLFLIFDEFMVYHIEPLKNCDKLIRDLIIRLLRSPNELEWIDKRFNRVLEHIADIARIDQEY